MRLLSFDGIVDSAHTTCDQNYHPENVSRKPLPLLRSSLPRIHHPSYRASALGPFIALGRKRFSRYFRCRYMYCMHSQYVPKILNAPTSRSRFRDYSTRRDSRTALSPHSVHSCRRSTHRPWRDDLPMGWASPRPWSPTWKPCRVSGSGFHPPPTPPRRDRDNDDFCAAAKTDDHGRTRGVARRTSSA